ncbi:MAG: O-antigen ligase domain-containing protein [Betaproteobacteria bacterium]|nr:O-antigen ligase domain-containing protein [Betaproteobacteria bacterium]
MTAGLARLRLWSLCFLALSVSLGTALVSLGKLFLLLVVLAQIFTDVRQRNKPRDSQTVLAQAWPSSLWWGATALLWMGLSMAWSATPVHEAWPSLARHARWLVFPAAFYLMRAGTPAQPVLQSLVLGQLFVLVSSWLMVLGIPLPWAISVTSPDNAVVFSSSIEQPITCTLMMLVIWYFRDQWPLAQRRFWLWTAMALATANVLLVVTGRTGQMAMLLAWVFVLWGCLPGRYRWGVLLLPVLVALGVGLGSERMQQRWLKAKADVLELQAGPLKIDNSVGFRIDAWQKSVHAFAEKPLLGHGVGAWPKAYVDQGGTIAKANDPHQQFLLWAVESGLVGLVLFMGFLVGLWRNAQNLPWHARWCLRSAVAIEVLTGLVNSTLLGVSIGEFFLLLWAGLLACHKQFPDDRSQGFLPPSQ